MVFNACVYLSESVKCHGGVYSQQQNRKKTQHQVISNIQVVYPVKKHTHTCTSRNSISIHKTINIQLNTQYKLFTLVNTWREAPLHYSILFIYLVSYDWHFQFCIMMSPCKLKIDIISFTILLSLSSLLGNVIIRTWNTPFSEDIHIS